MAGRYERALRRSIVQWKFNRCLGLEPLLVELISDALARQPWCGEVDGLVPIPPPWMRWLRRGLVWPVADLAAGMSKQLSKPVWSVLRARGHQPQVGLSGGERAANMKRVFHVSGGIGLRDKRICIVDDVMTTGATLEAAATACLKGDARQVWAAVVAKTPGPANPGIDGVY